MKMSGKMVVIVGRLVSGAVVVLCLASLSASLPLHHKSSGQAVIVNGTEANVGYMEEAFVFCKVEVSTTDNLHHYHLQWRNPTGDTVARWSKENSFVYSLGTGSHLPHSYLVFHDFSSKYAGDYSCVLLYDNTEVHWSAVTISSSS